MSRCRPVIAGRQCVGEQFGEEEHLDSSFAHPGDELVVLVLRPLDPQHVVEQQLVVVRRRQPLQAQVRAVDHHLAELAHLRVHTELAHDLFLSRLVGYDRRAGVALDDLLDVLQRADRGVLAGRLDEPGGGFHLRAHRPGSEGLAAQLARCHPVEPALVSRPPVLVHAVDVRGHQEQVGIDLASEQLARQVLVDDRLDAPERSFLVRHPGRRDPSTAGADDEHAVLEQPANRPDLEDPLRRRRRDDSAKLVSVALEDPPLLGGQGVGGGIVVDRSDELGRVGERRIVRIDLDHREDRGERDLGGQQVAELLLDEIADHSLRLGAEDVQGVRLDLLVGGRLQGEEADLGTVAVRQHELVMLGDRGERIAPPSGCWPAARRRSSARRA